MEDRKEGRKEKQALISTQNSVDYWVYHVDAVVNFFFNKNNLGNPTPNH